MEDKFRRLNDSIRRFGGTIQGGLARQDPARRAEVRRYNQEQRQRVVVEEPLNAANNRNRQWPTLCPNLNNLNTLWTEYEFGIGGRKAAKLWTAVERGNPKCKQTYYGRNCIWRTQLLLINKGHNLASANDLILRTYGILTSITNIARLIVADRSRYKHHGGLHPNFR
jgi:hypothetical protein